MISYDPVSKADVIRGFVSDGFTWVSAVTSVNDHTLAAIFHKAETDFSN
jgi:hypothetical protein